MNYHKIAPGLLSLLDDLETRGRPALMRHVRTLGVTHVASPVKPPSVVVFLRCDPQADVQKSAEALGIRVNQRSGHIRTAYLPVQRLEELSRIESVKRIVPARYLRLKMDLAGARCQIPAYRARTASSGRGVIVGVIDSGIDPGHPAFQGRIRSIWDQTITGNGVDEGRYGLELTGAQMTASRDRNGHGTHVAGIAAGDDQTFAGVAPSAELVIVKSTLQDAHIGDGIRYVFRVAQELGRPAVINLSLGGHYDAHDGTDPLSALIDEESGPGRIVCCAAGNEGDDNIHAAVRIPAGGGDQMRFLIPPRTTALLNGWYSGGDRLAVAVQSPDGLRTPFQGPIHRGPFTFPYRLPMGTVTLATPRPGPDNGDHQVEVLVRPSRRPIVAPTVAWRLLVRPIAVQNGRLDVWSIDGSGDTTVFFTSNVADRMKIGSPGCARSAITVASFTTRTHWVDQRGQPQSVDMALDDISSFSSEGPLRTGGQKPDVAAPGAMIAAPASADAPFGRRIAPGFRLEAGTSMATPFITGVVALMLERAPALDPADARQQLRARSSRPNGSPGAFDAKWGFGLLDAQNL